MYDLSVHDTLVNREGPRYPWSFWSRKKNTL